MWNLHYLFCSWPLTSKSRRKCFYAKIHNLQIFSEFQFSLSEILFQRRAPKNNIEKISKIKRKNQVNRMLRILNASRALTCRNQLLLKNVICSIEFRTNVNKCEEFFKQLWCACMDWNSWWGTTKTCPIYSKRGKLWMFFCFCL